VVLVSASAPGAVTPAVQGDGRMKLSFAGMSGLKLEVELQRDGDNEHCVAIHELAGGRRSDGFGGDAGTISVYRFAEHEFAAAVLSGAMAVICERGADFKFEI